MTFDPWTCIEIVACFAAEPCDDKARDTSLISLRVKSGNGKKMLALKMKTKK